MVRSFLEATRRTSRKPAWSTRLPNVSNEQLGSARASRCAVRHNLDVPEFKLGHSRRNEFCQHENLQTQGKSACFSNLFLDGHTFSKFRGVPRYCTQFQKMFANYMPPSKKSSNVVLPIWMDTVNYDYIYILCLMMILYRLVINW